MVRDWVMLSLSNFTQRTPVAMAVWSLSCFFVSASTSQWISAMYPKQTECVSLLGKCDSVKDADSLGELNTQCSTHTKETLTRITNFYSICTVPFMTGQEINVIMSEI